MSKLENLMEDSFRRNFAFDGAVVLSDGGTLTTTGEFKGMLIGGEGAVFTTLTGSIVDALDFKFPAGAFIPGKFTEVTISEGTVLLIK